MPTLRNRSLKQEPGSGTKCDEASADATRSQSRNSNEVEKNHSTEDAPAPRLLRDRASLAARAASNYQAQLQQQQQQQHLHQQKPQQRPQQHQDQPELLRSQPDSGKTTPSGRDTPSNSSKHNSSSKGLAPTRVLSRRSSFRPQSLLKRGTTDEVDSPRPPQNEHVPSKTTHEPPSAAKKPRHEELKVPETGLDLTKRAVNPAQFNKVAVSANIQTDRQPTQPAITFINRDRSNPSVRITLPGGRGPTYSSASAYNLKGSQGSSAKRFGLLPLGFKIASEIRSKMATASSSSATNMNSTNNPSLDKIHPQSLLSSNDRRQQFNILIAVTGSVATIKLIELIRKLHLRFPQTFMNKNSTNCVASITIKVIMTKHSKHFINKSEISKCVAGRKIEVYDDNDEWTQWTKMGDPVLHIELRKWADLCLIAPLDANTLAKLANGLCDNLLTCVVRAWNTSKRLIYCPAMNVFMYNHPITKEHLCKLQSFGYLRVDCIEKTLACGDVGLGAMASVETIIDKVVDTLLRPSPRLISPTKPLLNQQPTYQIMSTSDRPATSAGSSNANLMDRFRSADRSNLSAVNSSIRSFSSNGTSSRSFPHSSTPQSDAFKLLFPAKKPQQQQQQQIHRVSIQEGNHANLNLINSKQGRSNLVQSLKNLRAINPDLSADTNGFRNEFADDDCDDEEDEGEWEDDDDDKWDFIDDGGLELSSPEADNHGNDLDPSNLLEQSLITTDEPQQGRQSRGGSVNSFSNLSSVSNNFNTSLTANRTDGFTPFMNTSKFLTMCYVKDRDCFNCAICKNDYKNRKSMSRHLREQHVQGNIYQCGPCGVGFKRREKLIKHNRDRHGILAEPAS